MKSFQMVIQSTKYSTNALQKCIFFLHKKGGKVKGQRVPIKNVHETIKNVHETIKMCMKHDH